MLKKTTWGINLKLIHFLPILYNMNWLIKLKLTVSIWSSHMNHISGLIRSIKNICLRCIDFKRKILAPNGWYIPYCIKLRIIRIYWLFWNHNQNSWSIHIILHPLWRIHHNSLHEIIASVNVLFNNSNIWIIILKWWNKRIFVA
jgi:hypothetical protein